MATYPSMAQAPAAADTLNTMLLQEKDSVRIQPRRATPWDGGEAGETDWMPVTVATRRALERDLASLRDEQREIPARLRIAREFGDSANNDKHQAIREDQAVLAARIARLEDILMRATVVGGVGGEDSVDIGSSVNVVDVDTGEQLEDVVGSAHGVLSRGTVSALSPVGRALLGRREGQRVAIQLRHRRRRQLEVREIHQPPEPSHART